MSTINRLTNILPQDTLLSVSEFGQVHPDLSPEYISRVTSNLSLPDHHINWASEIRLQELRSQNSLHPVVQIAQENNAEVSIGSFRRRFGIFINSRSGLNRRVSQDLNNIGIDSVATRQGVFIPTNGVDTEVELDEAMRLKNIRSGLYTSDDQSVAPSNISNITPQDLVTSGIFPRTPTDLEMIAYLIETYPNYDLGELLQWLRLRAESCSDGTNADIHHLIRLGVVEAHASTGHRSNPSMITRIGLTIGVNPQSSRQQIDDIFRIMAMRGLTLTPIPGNPRDTLAYYSVVSWDRSRRLGDIIDEFMRDFNLARMCYIDYNQIWSQ